MRVIICENYEEMSKAAAKLVSSQLTVKPESVLGLATGSTPIGMYNLLADMYKNGDVDFSEAKSFNLDEYYPITADNSQSYHYFMQENLFSKINIKPENTHILDGTCADTDAECDKFEKMIVQSGGIDLQILGIGQNGHIGFNEPDANLNPNTHLTDLTENTINANSRFFDNIDEVPKQAITMGIGTILKAKKIILMASGAEKHKVVKQLIEGKITTDIPASMLKVHSDTVLICDKAAYSSERIGVDIGGTDIKFGVLNDNNELIHKESIPTDASSEENLINEIADKCRELADKFSINGIGVGTPGLISGGLVTASNVPFNNTPLAKRLEEKLGISVRVANDANCAALGESTAGAGRKAKNIVMITLGTGVGGGIIIKNKLYEGKGSAGEIGHIVIEHGGRPCDCGQCGCLEQYASASALSALAEHKAKELPQSILGKLYAEKGKMNGKIFFEAINGGCDAAKTVLDEYTNYLADGINSIENIFEPDLIILSGGITNAGESLLEPLSKKVKTKIHIAQLKNDAGIVGAAMLQ